MCTFLFLIKLCPAGFGLWSKKKTNTGTGMLQPTLRRVRYSFVLGWDIRLAGPEKGFVRDSLDPMVSTVDTRARLDHIEASIGRLRFKFRALRCVVTAGLLSLFKFVSFDFLMRLVCCEEDTSSQRLPYYLVAYMPVPA